MLALLLACNGPEPLPTPTDDTSDEGGVPNLLVEESRLDFGVLDDVGQSATLTITIQNAGTGDLEVTGVTAEAPFSSLSQSVTLVPQSIGQLTIQFAPTAYALEQATTLVILSNDPDQPEIEVPLTGGVVVDADGDGYLRPEADGDDCDDGDATVNPGATEVFYDGEDQDCAGDDDYDQDLDGYQSDAFGGTDCNDVVAEIYPGAEDTWYDGVDTDCAGNNDFDMDQDGYGSKAHNKGKDCDDDDPDAYPSADERLNGKLDDCDGSRDWKVNPNTAPVLLTGDGNNQQTGFGIALGDYDGDGSTDTLVSARYDSNGVGAVYLLDGASFPTEADEDLPGLASDDMGGESSNAFLGSAMVTLNDGDLALSAYGQDYNYGKVYLFDGADLTSDFDTDSAHTTITGTSGAYYVGRGLGSSDLDGDGSDDTLMYYSSSTSSSSGQARIGLQYGGSDDGNISVNGLDAIFTTTATSTATYESMSGGYDLDGDGYEDWVYCDPGDDSIASNAGAVWVLWGSDSRFSGSDTLKNQGQRVVVGESSSDATGSHCVLLPDMDGDGKAELAVWTKGNGDLGIHFGTSFGGDTAYTGADWFLDMPDTNRVSVIRPTGDVNGNGTDDWVLGIDSNSSSDGRLYIFDGSQTGGDYEVDDAIAYVRTSTDDENNYYGHAIPVYPGDADNDGALDLLVGDYGYAGEINGDGNTHTGTGAFYVYFGL